MKLYILTFLSILLALPTLAQQRRPIPYPVIPSPQFEQALLRGTRSANGTPGPEYWTNTADYTLQVTLDPETAMLTGFASIEYNNHSPDMLAYLVVHLRQNLHAEGAVRNRPQEVTGGVTVSDVQLNGVDIEERIQLTQGGYQTDGTLMYIRLPTPLDSGASITLSMNWSFRVPKAGAPRMGQDGEVFYLAYWYPQFSVYDDLEGWKTDQYMGNGEFYMGYGSYDVSITVPDTWLVAATGELLNASDILTEQTRVRLKEAAETGAIVNIVTEEERGKRIALQPSNSGTHIWRFQADKVRDFAFGTSDKYVWDATAADVNDLDGDGQPDQSMIHAFYRPQTPSWTRSAEFSKYSIEFLSDMFFPYPYPHMTAVEGVIGGGMEFPMMTLIGRDRSDRSLFGVTFHEISHMWFPMVVGQDEKNVHVDGRRPDIFQHLGSQPGFLGRRYRLESGEPLVLPDCRYRI